MSDEIIEVGGFGGILRGGDDADWVPASFPMPGGGAWVYQEPGAVVAVQNGALTVAALPYTRSHDQVQFFDNAKHMYFSRRSFAAPAGGRITLEWELAARIVGAKPGDLYDGFVSFHLMDLARGVALNFFVGSDQLATVYAQLPFPGATAPERRERPALLRLVRGARRQAPAGRVPSLRDQLRPRRADAQPGASRATW